MYCEACARLGHGITQPGNGFRKPQFTALGTHFARTEPFLGRGMATNSLKSALGFGDGDMYADASSVSFLNNIITH